jgi:hypothetical protein
VPLPLDYQLRKYRRVRSRTGRSANPPLGRSEVWGMDDELVSRLVERCGGFEAGDVGTMSQLGHCETTNDAVETQHASVYPIR